MNSSTISVCCLIDREPSSLQVELRFQKDLFKRKVDVKFNNSHMAALQM